jgi:cytochrome c-type biogenesis protein CcmH
MIWVLLLGIAAVVFAVLAFVLKIPRAAWELTGAALLFGLAGYAIQGHPGLAGAPRAAVENQQTADAELVRQRQALGSNYGSGQSWLVMADALTRQGQFRAAADLLDAAIKKNPNDPDLWVALGNALTGHSEGTITPAARFAFMRAATIDPTHPGPPFFLGMALAQTGHLVEARAMWTDLLQRSPANAPFRRDLVARLARLDQLIAMSEGKPLPEAQGAPAAPDPAPTSR